METRTGQIEKRMKRKLGRGGDWGWRREDVGRKDLIRGGCQLQVRRWRRINVEQERTTQQTSPSPANPSWRIS